MYLIVLMLLRYLPTSKDPFKEFHSDYIMVLSGLGEGGDLSIMYIILEFQDGSYEVRCMCYVVLRFVQCVLCCVLPVSQLHRVAVAVSTRWTRCQHSYLTVLASCDTYRGEKSREEKIRKRKREKQMRVKK
jgi:hypothetical protein